MNDSAVKNYAIWARRELMEGVAKRAAFYGIFEDDSEPADAVTIDGRVLSHEERRQRRELLELEKRDGYRQLVERAAYTWFNRLLAIRFMEVNDRLPSHVRMLSAPDGSFAPQALSEALDLPLKLLDPKKAAELVQNGDDEELFRLVFLAQCDELADCMPGVFEHVGGAMELLLPDGLLRTGGVVEQLVTAIPEKDWTEGVEIVGWMYQYYVSERKDEVFAGFKKNKKAERGDIAPATQLFTPNWIVRYLVENSLGRLWVLNNPESKIVERMPYFVKPDEDAETEFRRIGSPEEITVVDPACGSGHILVYAFDLLAAMYTEAGYSERDAARLIVEKNLAGLEIDPRAAAMASFAVMMKACELDSRFLRRGVTPKITVLERVEFAPEELQYIPSLKKRHALMDAANHLDECGSLLTVSAADLDAVAGDLSALAGERSLFSEGAAEKLARLQAELEPLSRRYDVVVANPPYMGSSNMNSWVSNWVKKTHPRAKSDLCTCFFERGQSLAGEQGYIGMITASSWMFISSFEKFRKALLATGSICSMIQQSTHGYAGVTVPTTMFVYACNRLNITGSYVRLTDFDRPQWQEPRALEALANPDCGWFFKADAANFNSIPGCPIAYWASKSIIAAFLKDDSLAMHGRASKGLITGDNDVWFRYWWEITNALIKFDAASNDDAIGSRYEWFPLNKGGSFRKWYGNQEYIIRWLDGGNAIHEHAKRTGHHSQDYDSDLKFKPNITWSDISTGAPSFRYRSNELADHKGMPFFPRDYSIPFYLAYLNSSVITAFLEFLSPTLSMNLGELYKLPCGFDEVDPAPIEKLAESCVELAKLDWDSFEVSWGFEHHPLM